MNYTGPQKSINIRQKISLDGSGTESIDLKTKSFYTMNYIYFLAFSILVSQC